MERQRFDELWSALKEILHHLVAYRDRNLIKTTFYKAGRLTADDRDEIIANISNYIHTFQHIFKKKIADNISRLIEQELPSSNQYTIMKAKKFRTITRNLNINFFELYPKLKVGFWLFGYQKVKIGDREEESHSSTQIAKLRDLLKTIIHFGDTDEQIQYFDIEGVSTGGDRIYAFDQDDYPRIDDLLFRDLKNEIPVLYPNEFTTYFADLEYITENEADELREPPFKEIKFLKKFQVNKQKK